MFSFLYLLTNRYSITQAKTNLPTKKIYKHSIIQDQYKNTKSNGCIVQCPSIVCARRLFVEPKQRKNKKKNILNENKILSVISAKCFCCCWVIFNAYFLLFFEREKNFHKQ